MNCECDPGTEENGWHETRCAECYEVELEAWRNMARLTDEYWAGLVLDETREEA